MYFTLTFLPVTCHMSFTSSFRYQRRRSVLRIETIEKFVLFCSHCIQLLFGSPPCVKMNERRHSDVVSGSGKFIFAVSTGFR